MVGHLHRHQSPGITSRSTLRHDGGSPRQRRCIARPTHRIIASADTATWEQRLSAVGVPAAPVLELQDGAEPPTTRVSQHYLQAAWRTGHRPRNRAEWLRLTAGPDGPAVIVPPPAKGQHTADVLREAGYSMAEIDILRAERVV
jgi:crotonobetainyl-CoA:carnitine CoA-transferase CaiB-like acyl-CoA transferase